MSLSAGLIVLVAALLLFLGFVLVPIYRTYRGRRLITCPETNQPAAVDVDAVHAATSSLTGRGELRLRDCSRWPEKAGCGQECLAEVERSPGECLVRTVVAEWYHGKVCFFCGRAIPEFKWSEHRPGLVSPEGATVSWTDVRPEELPAIFETYRPVCWDCHIVQSVVRERPDVITVRPDRRHLYS